MDIFVAEIKRLFHYLLVYSSLEKYTEILEEQDRLKRESGLSFQNCSQPVSFLPLAIVLGASVMEASFFGFFLERIEIVIENQASNPFYVGKEYRSKKKRERERTRKKE